MKNICKVSAAFFLFLFTLCCLSACAPAVPVKEEDSIVGTWEDAYGLTEYKFYPDGKMSIQALNLGSFDGTYVVSGNTITIRYDALIKVEENTYMVAFKGGKLYLDEQEFTRKK